MRAAIDVRSLMEGRLSGVEVYTTELIQALCTLAPEENWSLFYNAWAKPIMPDFAPVTWHVSHWPNKLFNVAQYVVGKPTWDALVDADVFFVPNVRLIPLTHDTPLVVTAHDLSFERFPELYSFKRRRWHQLMRPRDLMQRADHIIAVSQATRDDVVELYGIEPERISVVYSGVSLPVGGDIREHVKLPPHFILYLGTLEPRKNIVSLVEAFSLVADSITQDLVIAGVPGWLTAPLTRAIAQSPVKERIHRIGFVPNKLKASLYATADLFVYPSFYEGFGFPPLESLLAGTPVVTSYNSALPEVVGKWATLIDPYKPAELAGVLRELLQDLPIVGESVQAEIRQKFSWTRSAQATLDILRAMR